jgi:hypothetical protein
MGDSAGNHFGSETKLAARQTEAWVPKGKCHQYNRARQHKNYDTSYFQELRECICRPRLEQLCR